MRSTDAARLFVPLCLCVSLLGGCEGLPRPFGPDPDAARPKSGEFAVGEPVHADLDLLWERSVHVLRNAGYRVDPARADMSEGWLESEWRVLLQPYRYKGVRNRAIVLLEHDAATADTYTVSVAVLSQRNRDIDNPMDPLEAQWEQQPADMARARVLLYNIESGFKGRAEEARAAAGPQPTRARSLVSSAEPLIDRALNPSVDPEQRADANVKAFGLLKDARGEYERFLEANPDRSAAVATEYSRCLDLLDELQLARGR